MVSVIAIAAFATVFERRGVRVVHIAAAAAPFREAVFESQFGDYADFGRVGERGALIEDHLVNDVGAVGREDELGADGRGELSGSCLGAGCTQVCIEGGLDAGFPYIFHPPFEACFQTTTQSPCERIGDSRDFGVIRSDGCRGPESVNSLL